MKRMRMKEPSSFRDPDGFVFRDEGTLYRQVNESYRDDYERLLDSGLYDELVREGLLVPHEEADLELALSDRAYRVLRPEEIPFVSYPYEWSFGQLRRAALTVLDVQERALDCGMTLKDASAYNIQFVGSRPLFIDTLSFTEYAEGEPWAAYRQFCRHFLAPLAVMSYRDVRIADLLRSYIDGLPLDLVSSLLPLRTRGVFSLLAHIHLHAASKRFFSRRPERERRAGMGSLSLRGLISSLRKAVRRLAWEPSGSEWVDYSAETSYSRDAFQAKKRTVEEYLEGYTGGLAWDLGANVGVFSRMAAERGLYTVAFDMDAACVELNYRRCREEGEQRVLPLRLDLENPSPALGWQHEERDSLLDRGPADLALALALVHHLAIGNNVPLRSVARFMARSSRRLIVEFVPRADPQVQKLLAGREDIFENYDREHFEAAFASEFRIRDRAPLPDSHRVLYLMDRRERDGKERDSREDVREGESAE